MAEAIPPEILEIILRSLPSRSLYHAAIVSRSWYSTAISMLYYSVDFYSVTQYERFIQGLEANRNRLHSGSNKNVAKSNGQHVQKLTLHTSNIMLTPDEFTTLQILCPEVTQFDYALGTQLTDEHLGYFLPHWPRLKHLPSWHEDDSKDWIAKLSSQLISLSCHYEKLDSQSDFMHATTKFPFLTTLQIKMHYSMEPLTISWMEIMNDRCPYLVSLDLDMVLSPNSDTSNDCNDDTLWQPAPSLRVFQWKMDSLFNNIWYNYFTQKYPNMQELKLTIHNDHDSEFDERSDSLDSESVGARQSRNRQGVFDMITSYQHLTGLGILFEGECRFVMNYFPLNQLAIWLSRDHANGIRKLEWQIDAYSDQDDSLHDTSLLFRGNPDPFGNIQQLYTLACQVHHTLPPSLMALLNGDINFQQLNTLHLSKSEQSMTKNVNLDALLNGCPALTTLIISNLKIITRNQHSYTKHRRLSDIQLRQCSIDCLDQVSCLLNACPRVNKLRCIGVSILSSPKAHQKVFAVDAPNITLSILEIRSLTCRSFTFQYLHLKQRSQPDGYYRPLGKTKHLKDSQQEELGWLRMRFGSVDQLLFM